MSERERKPNAARGRGDRSFGRLVFLIVDSNPLTRTLVSDAVQRHGARDVVEIPDARDALRFVDEEDVDVVIVNADLPMLPGSGLVRALRESGKPRLETLPCVLITGRPDPSLEGDAEVLDFVLYVSRRFSAEALTAHIERALTSEPHTAPITTLFGLRRTDSRIETPLVRPPRAKGSGLNLVEKIRRETEKNAEDERDRRSADTKAGKNGATGRPPYKKE